MNETPWYQEPRLDCTPDAPFLNPHPVNAAQHQRLVRLLRGEDPDDGDDEGELESAELSVWIDELLEEGRALLATAERAQDAAGDDYDHLAIAALAAELQQLLDTLSGIGRDESGRAVEDRVRSVERAIEGATRQLHPYTVRYLDESIENR